MEVCQVEKVGDGKTQSLHSVIPCHPQQHSILHSAAFQPPLNEWIMLAVMEQVVYGGRLSKLEILEAPEINTEW